jgi:hypothetical protein
MLSLINSYQELAEKDSTSSQQHTMTGINSFDAVVEVSLSA